MLRLAAVFALLCSLVTCLRMDPAQNKDSLPEKKVTGPEHHRCSGKRIPKCDACTYRQDMIGGTLVDDPAEFPFLAWVGDNDGTQMSQFCGGSLISDRVVLTAGHCLYSSDFRNAMIWVRFKLTNFQRTLGIARTVVNWRRHPGYNPITVKHDLSLLLLNESIPADLIEPLRLSDGTRPFEHTGDKMLAGWGSTDEGCRIYDTLLRKARIPMGTDGPECSTKDSKRLTPNMEFDYHRQCCAGDYSGDMNYPGCGDSGGPLMAIENGTSYQVGMVSWSFGIPYPDVFTRISYYGDWIAGAAKALVKDGVHPAVAAMQSDKFR